MLHHTRTHSEINKIIGGRPAARHPLPSVPLTRLQAFPAPSSQGPVATRPLPLLPHQPLARPAATLLLLRAAPSPQAWAGETVWLVAQWFREEAVAVAGGEHLRRNPEPRWHTPCQTASAAPLASPHLQGLAAPPSPPLRRVLQASAEEPAASAARSSREVEAVVEAACSPWLRQAMYTRLRRKVCSVLVCTLAESFLHRTC